MAIKEILADTEHTMKKSLEAMIREFNEVRSGRANPHIVEGLMVNYYDTPTLLKQIASISVPDARLIVIQPWDPTAIVEIEKAILKSNLGLNPANDGKVIRLPIPQLSKERRGELIKVIKEVTEKGRVSLRTIRRDANDTIKKMEHDKKITEDDRFKGQEEVQKITDKYIKKLDDLEKEKEKELSEF